MVVIKSVFSECRSDDDLMIRRKETEDKRQMKKQNMNGFDSRDTSGANENGAPITIRTLRTSLGMNQEAFGQSLGLSKMTISAYETGRLAVSSKTKEKVRSVYHVSLEEDGAEKPASETLSEPIRTFRQLRNSLGITQGQLAEALGLRVQTISAYERDKISPSRKVVDKIQELYGVEIRSNRMEEQEAKKKEQLEQAQNGLGRNPSILQIRTARGLSQAAFAQAIEVSPQAVSAYETGRMEPSRKTWEKIRDVFGVDHLDLRKMTPDQVVLEFQEGKSVSVRELLERIGPADVVTIRTIDQTAHWTKGGETGSIRIFEDNQES